MTSRDKEREGYIETSTSISNKLMFIIFLETDINDDIIFTKMSPRIL